jgi:fructan beta-fructosidase
MKSVLPLSCALLAAYASAAEPIMLADFEGKDYGAWKAEGKAFGDGPAHGRLGGQMVVAGFAGKGLANSYHGGDGTTGTLTSPSFRIERKYLTFLIGGGGWAGQTCFNLIVDGKVVRSATGQNTEPGGSETLEPGAWDVSEFLGQEARLVAVDRAQGGWGHILVDQVVLTDATPAPVIPDAHLERSLQVDGVSLLVPVSNLPRRGGEATLSLYLGTDKVQDFTVNLPRAGEPSWLASYPLSAFGLAGKTVRLTTAGGRKLPAECRAAFESIRCGDEQEALRAANYDEPYRNQFHASSRLGWNNDPNGMVFANGKYHLYYQYNPCGIFWGNMHWGHLESTDLVRWEEQPIALFQRTTKDMAYSGGGWIDVEGTAGLGKGTQFAAFTSTGRGECVAYSKDRGRTFNELPGNPMVKHKGRDPKVIWYAPERKWIMVVYSEDEWAGCADVQPDAGNKADAVRHLAFFASRDLRDWQLVGGFTDPDRSAVYECPEMFELPVVGAPGQSRWIVTAASNRYFIGTFDGRSFHKEAGPFGTRHGAFYAAQTFSDVPDGRRIQIGWLRTDTYLDRFPAQHSNQGFTLPHELTLRSTPVGLRLFFTPVKELESLRGGLIAEGADLTAEQATELLQKCRGELSEVLIELSGSSRARLRLNGVDVSFKGQRAQVFADRIVNETYVDDGATYEITKRPAKEFDSTQTRLELPAGVKVVGLKAYRLNSIWPK